MKLVLLSGHGENVRCVIVENRYEKTRSCDGTNGKYETGLQGIHAPISRSNGLPRVLVTSLL